MAQTRTSIFVHTPNLDARSILKLNVLQTILSQKISIFGKGVYKLRYLM